MDREHARAETAAVILRRRGQSYLRIGIAAALVLGFGPFLGWSFSAVWFLSYASLQLLERRMLDDPAPLDAARVRLALTLIVASGVMFGAIAVVGPLRDGAWSLACIGFLLGGAILNGVTVAIGSRPVFVASIAPFAFYAGLMPFEAGVVGADLWHCLMIALAGTMMIVAAVMIWRVATASRGAEIRARFESEQHRRQAEQEREIAQQALQQSRQSEALYRLLADNQTDVITLWTAEGKLHYTSPSVERACGFTPAEILAMGGAGNAHPDDVPALQALAESLEPGTGGKAEYRLLHKDGSEMWVEGSFHRLDDGSEGLLATTRIISERKRLEGQLVRALDEAKSALAAKAEFLANMSHELRTPLNAIVGFAGVLRDDADLSPRQARQVGLVWEASQTLLGVVNDVLDFSKLEAGAIDLEAHAFDPVEMAEQAVSLLGAQAAAKRLRLSVQSRGPGGPLLGDGMRLRQVVTNFVSNAVKFTAHGAIEVLVKQTADGDRRRLRVAVKDSGIGVPPDQIRSIFGRFTQADASVSRKFGGTGLGLAICKRIVETMGGEIGVDSVVGVGSTFWFEVVMPVAQADAHAERGAQKAVSVDSTLRLLIVDDNAINRELISTVLEPFDLHIETAKDGAEAIDAVARAPFDLILMDVQMPNMDGLTATRRIRAAAAPGARRIPIIAMTANVLPEQVESCREAGMDDHLGKPISPAKLLETLARWSPQPAGASAGVAEDQAAGRRTAA